MTDFNYFVSLLGVSLKIMNSSSQVSSEILLRSIDNLINICENGACDLGRHRDKLNIILNDLNAIDFKYIQNVEINKVSKLYRPSVIVSIQLIYDFHLNCVEFQRIEDILRVLICVPLAEDTIIVKCVHLIVQLLDKTPTNISRELFRSALRYSLNFIEQHKFVGICDALRLMQAIISNHFKNEAISIGAESIELIESIKLLILLISDPDAMKKSTSCHYDGYSVIEIKSSAVFCLEAILTMYEKLPTEIHEFDAAITKALLHLIYSVRLNEISPRTYCNLMRSTLNACRYIGFANKEWCTENIGDLLGVCVSNMLFGLPDYVYQSPQRIQSSQQTIQDTHNSSAGGAKKGGKLIKNRKPRQTPPFKNRKSTKTSPAGDDDKNEATAFDQSNNLFENPGEKFEICNFTTSDSDASDPENGRTGQKTREKEAKLRLAAISLIAIVAKVCRFVFFCHFEYHLVFTISFDFLL